MSLDFYIGHNVLSHPLCIWSVLVKSDDETYKTVGGCLGGIDGYHALTHALITVLRLIDDSVQQKIVEEERPARVFIGHTGMVEALNCGRPPLSNKRLANGPTCAKFARLVFEAMDSLAKNRDLIIFADPRKGIKHERHIKILSEAVRLANSCDKQAIAAMMQTSQCSFTPPRLVNDTDIVDSNEDETNQSWVHIYTDGSYLAHTGQESRGSGGPGGWGYAIYNGESDTRYATEGELSGLLIEEQFGWQAMTSAAQMEVLAVLNGLKKARELGFRKVKVYSDAMPVISAIKSDLWYWASNNWKTRQGASIINQKQWEQIHSILSSKCMVVECEWVKSHTGCVGNERADELAKRGSSLALQAFRARNNKEPKRISQAAQTPSSRIQTPSIVRESLERIQEHALQTTPVEPLMGLMVKHALSNNPDMIIGDADDPYLVRWWFRRSEESSIYLHLILKDDKDKELHDHPWDSTSYMLHGTLREHTKTGQHIYTKGDLVMRKAEDAHRLEVIEGPVLTMFMTGPRKRNWGFWCGETLVPWQQYVDPANKGLIGQGCGEHC